MLTISFSRFSFFLPFLVPCVYAYIPAQPTNSSLVAEQGGLNVTDISKLYMQWYPDGSYSESVSFQLAGNGSSGISKGALVHFSEDYASNLSLPTTTPWIALVSCDRNATNVTLEEDIFTLARDKGAVAALLYTTTFFACVINPEYADPANFDQVFDIFSTQNLTSAHLIEDQFGQLNGYNHSILNYNPEMLDQAAANISQSVANGYAYSPGFIYAVLQAYNATEGTGIPTMPGGSSSNTGSPSSSSSPNTALAMIILYAITGCVSALFCVVIISGAIRAIRHPERYGPRARGGGNGEGSPQSRARGLARAVLDTFPVVKFGSSNNNNSLLSQGRRKDVESNATSRAVNEMELKAYDVNKDQTPGDLSMPETPKGNLQPQGIQISIPLTTPGSKNDESAPESSRSMSPRMVSPQTDFDATDQEEGSSRTSRTVPPGAEREDVVPASMGRETCPICIVDFEEGDDIRVLPCEGKHCFHKQCVDPWLLELSSSCPICRHDFVALEAMLSGGSTHDHDDNYPRSPLGSVPHHSHNRFSRYLRFARRRRHGDESDPTDPYMPTATETSMYPGM